MNPHFLFNSLNTIASLVNEAPHIAEEMTVQLAEMYRSMLAASKKPLQSLAEELELCQTYLAVEHIRFGDRLTTTIDLDLDAPTSEIMIPPLVVQPLIENALKYAIAPRSKGGIVRISVRSSAEAIEIAVEDDGPGFGNSPVRGGMGTTIENCRQRLRMYFGAKADLMIGPAEREGTITTIRIPVPGEAALRKRSNDDLAGPSGR